MIFFEFSGHSYSRWSNARLDNSRYQSEHTHYKRDLKIHALFDADWLHYGIVMLYPSFPNGLLLDRCHPFSHWSHRSQRTRGTDGCLHHFPKRLGLQIG